MSVQSQIDRIDANITAAYSAAADKGATMPATQNSDNLAATISSIASAPAAADYVVEQGTSGGWTYIKLKSGIAMCWGRYFGNVNAAANNWSGYYYSGAIEVDFPFAFKTLEAVNFDGGSNDYLNFARNFASTLTQARFIIAGHSADATNVGIDVSIAAKGRWK